MFTFFPLGDSALLVKVDQTISIEAHKKIRALIHLLNSMEIDGIIEHVPAYNELMIVYNPSKTSFQFIHKHLKGIEDKLEKIDLPTPKIIHIPVCYDKKFSIDMDIVSATNNIDCEEVVQIHSKNNYLIYMLGFTPGFCYLGGMNEKIATPRKENPRSRIEAGSVGIAGKQTGIYPIDSPGGWQIIGKTPLKLFDPNKKNPFLIEAGNTIKFDPISLDEYFQIERKVQNESYEVKIEKQNE